MGDRVSGLAAELYARSTRVLPVALRREYGREMVADFRSIADASAARGGAPAVLAVLARGVVDVVRRAPAEWAGVRRSRLRAAQADGGRRGGRTPLQDGAGALRQAGRALLRRPAFTAAAVITLAVGMGATLAIYTVVESVLLRPLPYPDSDQIVTITHSAPKLDLPPLENSVGTLALYRDRSRTLSSVAGTDNAERNLTGSDQPARVPILLVSEEFFDVMAVEPALGRRFLAEEVVPGPERVAILMHGAWRDRFGGAADVIGRVIRLDGQPLEVVGVMPASFRAPSRREVELLLPYHLDPERGAMTFGIEGVMRMADGVDVATAQREVNEIQAQLAEVASSDFSPQFFERTGWQAQVATLRSDTVGDIGDSLWILLGTVGLVLLIACANVANLLLVRGEARQREVTIRSALGAAKRHIVATYVAESMVVAVLGGALGLVLAWAGVRLLVAQGPASLPRLGEVRLDGSVALLALGMALLAGLGLAVAPAIRGLRGLSGEGLRDGGTRTTEGRARQRGRSMLIAVQVALALVLLVGSGLMLRSFLRLRSVDPGVSTRNVIEVGVSRGGDADPATAAAFYQRVVDEVSALPGVVVAGATSSLPLLSDGLNGSSFALRSRPRAEDELPPVTMYTTVLPGYFESVGMRVLEGRAPERADHEARREVAWVNQTFATRFLDGVAVGDGVRLSSDSTWIEIVGVVNDVRMFGLDEEIRPMMYLPPTTSAGGTSWDLMHVTVQYSGDVSALTTAIRGVVRRIDPGVPVTTVQTMEAVVARSIASMSFTLLMLGVAAGVALLLGLVGLYGAIAYVVAQRTREIGVRIALGADAGRVSRMVMRQGLTVVAAGVVVGLLAAGALTRLMAALLYEIEATDPVTFAVVPLILLAVGAFASWLPARRASRVSPLEALRAE